MNISLINPSSRVETSEKIEFFTPPLSIAYLAGALRDDGHRVQLIDNAVENLSLEEIISRVRDSDIVGVTSTTPTFSTAVRYIEAIKSELPNVFVIAGGVHVSFMPDEALKKGADAVCIGEGERTIVELAERIERGGDMADLRGICYREGERIKFNPPRRFEENLDALPLPAYDLLPMEKYSVVGRRLEYFPVISSRGCPFGCIYCVTSRFMGKKFRAKSAVRVGEELQWLMDEFGAKQIAFSDDTFTLNRKRVEEICREMKERGLDIRWSCSSRVDTVSGELSSTMAGAGCTLIYFGVESASENVLKFYRKKIDIKKAKDAVSTVKKKGMLAACSFILGAPMETESEMMETIETAVRLNPDYAQFSVLTPYPGTELYETAKKNQWLLTEDFDEYTAGKPVLKNFHLSPERIYEMLKYAYRRSYLRPGYILKRILAGDVYLASGLFRQFIGRKLRTLRSEE